MIQRCLAPLTILKPISPPPCLAWGFSAHLDQRGTTTAEKPDGQNASPRHTSIESPSNRGFSGCIATASWCWYFPKARVKCSDENRRISPGEEHILSKYQKEDEDDEDDDDQSDDEEEVRVFRPREQESGLVFEV